MSKRYKEAYRDTPDYYSLNSEELPEEKEEDAGRKCIRSCLVYISFLIAAGIIAGILLTAQSPDMYFNNETVGSLGGEWKIDYGKESVTAELPFYEKSEAGEKVVYSVILPKPDDKVFYNSVMFRALHEYVRVWLDDKFLYEFGYDQSVFFSDKPNNGWLIVRLPEEFAGKTLRIEKIGYYNNFAGKLDAVYVGTKNALVFYLLDKYLPIIFINLFIIVISGVLLVTSFFFKGKYVVFQLRYLSTFSMITSIWLVLESGGYQFFASHPPIVSNVLFIIFSLVPIVLIRFLLTFECFGSSRYMKVLKYMSFICFLLIHLMQLLGWVDYLKSIAVTHIMIVLSIGGIIGKFIELIVKKRLVNLSLFISCLVFACFVFADLARYYLENPYRPTLYCQIGFFCFFFILSYSAIRKIIIDNENSRKKQIFQQMAYTDILTGLPNRNAFEREMEYYKKEKEWRPVVLVADLNDLKSINDSYGHSQGDYAIVVIGSCLKAGFSDKGHIFRIGGDEFCVILKDINEADLQERMETFREQLEEKQKHLDIPISIAIGAARREADEMMIKVFNRADSAMYDNKRKMKNEK